MFSSLQKCGSDACLFNIPVNLTTIGDQYLRQCESQLYAHYDIAKDMIDKGILIAPGPSVNCDKDGSFSGQQCSGRWVGAVQCQVGGSSAVAGGWEQCSGRWVGAVQWQVGGSSAVAGS